MQKNTAGKWIVFAWTTSTGLAKTGDAAQITANVRIDGAGANAVDDTNPTELEDGFYIFDITAAECNGDNVVICPASSTSGVQVIGVPGAVWTRPPNFQTMSVDSNGRLDVIKVAGTTQTARDIGASVLLSSGTGTGQVSLSSGAVLLQATQTGVTIPTVTTVTNQLTAAAIATGVWQDATAGDFTTASSIGKALYTGNIVPGAAGGHFIAGTNAATAITTALTANITGNLSGSVGSVTGAVGSVTGAVGSVTGAVGSVAANGITSTSMAADAINAASLKTDAVTKIQNGLATPTNISAGTITTVTNLTNLPAVTTNWLTAAGIADNAIDAGAIATGAITSAKFAAGAIDAAAIATGAIDADAVAADAGTEIGTAVWATAARTLTAATNVTSTGAAVPITAGGLVSADVTALSTDTTAANNAEAFFDGTGYAGTNNVIPLVTVTTTATNLTNAATNGDLTATMKASVNAEVDAALNTAIPGSPTADSINQRIAAIDDLTQASGGGDLAAILLDTGTTLDALIKDVPTVTEFEARSLVAADYTVVSDLGTVQTGDAFARLGAPVGASISADIAAIEAQTDDIGTAGAGLTAVPWNAAWDAEVQSEVADALAVYDPPTNTEMEARTLVAASYATATALDAVDNYVDTEVEAIKAVTDKLNTALEQDGAVYRYTTNALEQAPTGGSAPTVEQIRTEMDSNSTKLAAILEDTGTTVPSQISGLNNLSAAQVTAAVPTVAQIVAGVWAQVIESGYTALASMRIMLSALAGKLSGAATTTIKIRDVTDAKDRITATVDSDGNRSSVTLDGS